MQAARKFFSGFISNIGKRVPHSVRRARCNLDCTVPAAMSSVAATWRRKAPTSEVVWCAIDDALLAEPPKRVWQA